MNKNDKNMEFFRDMKEQLKPDDEKVTELKDKLDNSAVAKRSPMWLGGVCAAAICVAIGAGLFLSDRDIDKNTIKTKESSSSQSDDSWLPKLINGGTTSESETDSQTGNDNKADESSKADESTADKDKDTKKDDSTGDTTTKVDIVQDNNDNNGGQVQNIDQNNGGEDNNGDNTGNSDNNGDDQPGDNDSDNNGNSNNNDNNGNFWDDGKSDANKPGSDDPKEFDDKDPVYPEIYVTDERMFDMTFNGNAFAFPAKYSDVEGLGSFASGLLGYFENLDPKNTIIEVGSSETFFQYDDKDYNATISIVNQGDVDALASECDVMGLFINWYDGFTVGGVGRGSTIEDANKAFGVNYTTECKTLTVHSKNGAFEDSKGRFTLTAVFTFNDGVVDTVGESKIYTKRYY